MLWEIFWLAAALLWGTFRVIQHKRKGSLPGENIMSFGQVLALLLSALPLWSFYSTIQEALHKPLSIDTTITSMRAIDGIGQLDQHSWFNGLVGLIFGTAVIFTGGTIYAFSASNLSSSWMGADTFYFEAPSVFAIYSVALACEVLVTMIFTSLAVAFHFNIIKISKLSVWWRHCTLNWSTWAQRRARRWVWIFSITSLLGVQLAVYLLIFGFFYVPSIYGEDSSDWDADRPV